jgi:hypothetical protein
MPAPSRSRNRATASANAGCASQWALVVLDGQQRARHFVLALGAAFKALVAVFYAPLQGLVVAGLKVQAVHALQGTPVAAIGHFVFSARRLGGSVFCSVSPARCAGSSLTCAEHTAAQSP